MFSYEKVKLARHPKRPTSKQVIKKLFPDFIELKGDRQFKDDPSIVGGIGSIEGIPVTIIGQEKGVNTKDKIYHNFGMPHPEGYRKALRLMKLAEKFNFPVVTLIDTPGAYPGIEAEERNLPKFSQDHPSHCIQSRYTLILSHFLLCCEFPHLMVIVFHQQFPYASLVCLFVS